MNELEELIEIIYNILSNNKNKIQNNDYMQILDYGDIDLNFKNKFYRIKIIEMED